MGRKPGPPPVPVEKRFWGKVDRRDPGQCWLWTAATDGFGYGMLGIGRHGTRRAHVISFELHKGPVPHGLVVRHACDNPRCVNPDHLELGTQLDNMRDRTDRGRVNVPRWRLPPAAISDIETSTEARLVLAARYGVS